VDRTTEREAVEDVVYSLLEFGRASPLRVILLFFDRLGVFLGGVLQKWGGLEVEADADRCVVAMYAVKFSFDVCG